MLKILRGLFTNLTTLAEGRMAVTTDTGDERLYIGTPAGNIRFASYKNVTDQIEAIKDNAPSTLNTFKEVASAINNDPSFNITINNELAQKASISALNSKADKTYVDSNVTSLQTQINARATTSYVDSKLLLKTSLAEVNADTDLINSTSATFPLPLTKGKSVLYSSGAANLATLVLPVLSSVLDKHTFFIYKDSAETFTLNPNGSETINSASSFSGIAGKTSYMVIKEAPANWLCLVLA